MLRSGTWTMITGMCFINIFSLLFGNGKSFFSIILLVVGILSLFVGVILCRQMYNRHIQGIYKRLKEKKINEKKMYNYENGIESSNGSDKSSEERSQSSSSENENNEGNLISVDSGEDSEDGKNKKDKKNMNNEESDSEEDDDEEYDSDKDSFQLSDRISEKITSFGSLREIINADIPNEPVIIYNSPDDFELACRFVWNNETREAFQLVRELYDECVKQYFKNPYILTYYAYYLLYVEERISKSAKDEIMGDIEKMDNDNDEEEVNNGSRSGSRSGNGSQNKEENQENENKLYDDKVNACNPDYLLSEALTCKLNIFNNYFVRYLLYEIKEKKKEDKDYYKKEAVEMLTKLQHEAIENHVAILNLLKKFFTHLKHGNNNSTETNFNTDLFLEMVLVLKNKTQKMYQNIIEKYPDEK
eukprot:jgi/Orpsp1_1/1188249/evm.model.d7180000063434.1